MHRFTLKKGQLWCENVPVGRIAKTVGTPLYLYSCQTLLDHYRKLERAFSPVRALICYAVKANGNLAVLRTLAQAGSGFDVVSGGELRKALRAGARPEKIVYASVGKTGEEIDLAIRSRVLFFNVESSMELKALEAACRRLKKRQRVCLRLNPGVQADTHAYIRTGQPASKFGMDLPTVEALFKNRREFPHLDLAGVHLHIGSQILESAPFTAAIQKAIGLARKARRWGVQIRYLNIGGGLGIVYHRETPQTAQAFADRILPLLKDTALQLILEPGRFIAGNSGILLTRVVTLKESGSKRFAVVDAGMNDLIRPSLYGAYHEVLLTAGAPERPRRRARLRYDVVGPVCESGDFFAKDRLLPRLERGDLLAILGAGAYGFAMSSNYNARPRAAEAMVRGRRWSLIRRRETFRDLIRGERLPPFLR